MKPGDRRYYEPRTDVCREALRRGPLVRDGAQYSTGSRKFAIGTVEKLVARGEAVRVGTGVIAAEHLGPKVREEV